MMFRITCVFFITLGAPLLSAAETAILSSQDIAAALTNDMTPLGVSVNIDSQGFSTPECSGHISLPGIQFDLGKAELLPDSKLQLEEVAAALHSILASAGPAAASSFKIAIGGHTCSVGKAEDNRLLSENRANAVRNYLVSKGLPVELFEVTGWGEERPRMPNETEAAQRYNRRIDFVLQKRIEQASLAHNGYLRVRLEARAESQGGKILQNQEIGSLKAGDGVKVRIRVLEGCHVYGLCLTSEGQAKWLIPSETTSGGTFGLWWYRGEEHILPGAEDSVWYKIEGRPGTDTIVLLASHTPVPKPGNLPALLKKHGTGLSGQILQNEDCGENIEVTCICIVHE